MGKDIGIDQYILKNIKLNIAHENVSVETFIINNISQAKKMGIYLAAYRMRFEVV